MSLVLNNWAQQFRCRPSSGFKFCWKQKFSNSEWAPLHIAFHYHQYFRTYKTELSSQHDLAFQYSITATDHLFLLFLPITNFTKISYTKARGANILKEADELPPPVRHLLGELPPLVMCLKTKGMSPQSNFS